MANGRHCLQSLNDIHKLTGFLLGRSETEMRDGSFSQLSVAGKWGEIVDAVGFFLSPHQVFISNCQSDCSK